MKVGFIFVQPNVNNLDSCECRIGMSFDSADHSTLISALFGNSSHARISSGPENPLCCALTILVVVSVGIPIPSPRKIITFLARFELNERP